MQKIIATYNRWHLGDNLIHLNFLRAMAKQHPDIGFMHYCEIAQHQQLKEMLSDLQNIQLNAGQLPPNAVDSWKNAGAQNFANGRWQTPGFFDSHARKFDWVNFHLDWFMVLTKRMGLHESPIKTPHDLLFSYPQLKARPCQRLNFDALVINSRPLSGQVATYRDDFCFDPLISELCKKGLSVACTQDTRVPDVFVTAKHGMTVTDLGNLSLRTPYIIGVNTGPHWPTHNAFNVDTVKWRVILLDRERVHLPGQGCHVGSVEEAMTNLKDKGIL